MGFVMLGLAAANLRAVAGAVLQMFSHGVIAGLLFAVVGRMVYDRTHTRKLAELRLLPLARLLPFAAVVFVLAGLASMGLPGFSGFPAELLDPDRRLAGRAALGRRGGPRRPGRRRVHAAGRSWPRFSGRPPGGEAGPVAGARWRRSPGREARARCCCSGATVVVGLKPDLLLNWICPACNRRSCRPP